MNNPVLRTFVRYEEMEKGEGTWAFDLDGQRAMRIKLEAKELKTMQSETAATESRKFAIMLLLISASMGGCTHMASTDGSLIGADASGDGKPHTACGVYLGYRHKAACGRRRRRTAARCRPTRRCPRRRWRR